MKAPGRCALVAEVRRTPRRWSFLSRRPNRRERSPWCWTRCCRTGCQPPGQTSGSARCFVPARQAAGLVVVPEDRVAHPARDARGGCAPGDAEGSRRPERGAVAVVVGEEVVDLVVEPVPRRVAEKLPAAGVPTRDVLDRDAPRLVEESAREERVAVAVDVGRQRPDGGVGAVARGSVERRPGRAVPADDVLRLDRVGVGEPAAGVEREAGAVIPDGERVDRRVGPRAAELRPLVAAPAREVRRAAVDHREEPSGEERGVRRRRRRPRARRRRR